MYWQLCFPKFVKVCTSYSCCGYSAFSVEWCERNPGVEESASVCFPRTRRERYCGSCRRIRPRSMFEIWTTSEGELFGVLICLFPCLYNLFFSQLDCVYIVERAALKNVDPRYRLKGFPYDVILSVFSKVCYFGYIESESIFLMKLFVRLKLLKTTTELLVSTVLS